MKVIFRKLFHQLQFTVQPVLFIPHRCVFLSEIKYGATLTKIICLNQIQCDKISVTKFVCPHQMQQGYETKSIKNHSKSKECVGGALSASEMQS